MKKFKVGKEYRIEIKGFVFKENGEKYSDENRVFMGIVENIYENHITFHKTDTVRTEGFKESFLKWDLENYLVQEVVRGMGQIAS